MSGRGPASYTRNMLIPEIGTLSDLEGKLTPRRCIGIVNPRCGRCRGMAVMTETAQFFSQEGISFDVHVTQSAVHAGDLAESLPLADYDCLCIIGGDGTVHDVVEGLMRRKTRPDIPLGVIPAGTGNTIHQEVYCCDVAQATSAIIRGQTRWLDVVKVESADLATYSINIVGWGGIADVNVKAEKLRAFGRCRYIVASLWQMLQPQARRARLVLDGDVVEDDFHFVIGCITKSTGTGMMLAPHAEIDDGLIDVVYVRKASRIQLLQMFHRSFDGSHLALPFVEYRQVNTLAVDSAEGNLNIDGENMASAPFTARVIPRALRICSAPSV